MDLSTDIDELAKPSTHKMVPNIQPCLDREQCWRVKENIKLSSHLEVQFSQNCWDPKELLLLHFTNNCISVCNSHKGIHKLYQILKSEINNKRYI